LTASRHTRRLKSRIDSERVRIFRCRYFKSPVTYSYGSIGKDGHKILTNVDGTRHVDTDVGGAK
jgi:hypothetical protein